jgi:hypothetical protein
MVKKLVNLKNKIMTLLLFLNKKKKSKIRMLVNFKKNKIMTFYFFK